MNFWRLVEHGVMFGAGIFSCSIWDVPGLAVIMGIAALITSIAWSNLDQR